MNYLLGFAEFVRRHYQLIIMSTVVFALVARQSIGVVTGLVLSFLFMPLLCWALARLLVHDSALATG